MNNKEREVTILGAGLVGTLLSTILVKKGYAVKIFERRNDLRIGNADRGRSINLALSNRGLKALQLVGLEAKVLEDSVSMKGRMVHQPEGILSFHPYGDEGQQIYSVSRLHLNKLLLDLAEKSGVNIRFEHKCESLNFETGELIMEDLKKKEFYNILPDFAIGADGAFSAVRTALQKTDRYNYKQSFLDYGYKELSIPAALGKSMEQHALHIWPRESFMLIALPNADGSFTCTLFLPFHGETSFEKIDNSVELQLFFAKHFPDAFPLMPDLQEEFFSNPTGALVTIECSPWIKNNFGLIGDAAHAIVPFYGQGMNAGFEDCTLLADLLNGEDKNIQTVFNHFHVERKKDTDAIASLALRNFVEMRDLVNDSDFIFRKKIEAKIHARYPNKYLPLYSMVTFTHIPYAKVLAIGLAQDKMMEEILWLPGIEKGWQKEEYWNIIEKIMAGYKDRVFVE